MSCNLLLRTQGLTGADPGGTWTYNGFHATSNTGPFAPGTFNPTLTGDDPAVDFTGAEPGYHQFTYTGLDCDNNPVSQNLVVAVVARPNAGTNGTVDACDSETITLILADYLTGEDTNGVWTHTGGTIDGGSTWTPGTGTLDLVNHPPTTLTFSYTVTPQAPGGYSLQSCINCDPVSSTVTVVVNADFIVGTANNLAVCN